VHFQGWRVLFLFSETAGEKSLNLRGEEYKYLFKVRRHNVDDFLYFRNKQETADSQQKLIF